MLIASFAIAIPCRGEGTITSSLTFTITRPPPCSACLLGASYHQDNEPFTLRWSTCDTASNVRNAVKLASSSSSESRRHHKGAQTQNCLQIPPPFCMENLKIMSNNSVGYCGQACFQPALVYNSDPCNKYDATQCCHALTRRAGFLTRQRKIYCVVSLRV